MRRPLFGLLLLILPIGALAGPIDNIAPNTWYEVPNSKLSDRQHIPYTNGGLDAIMAAWCGAAWDEKRQMLLVNGGGHATYDGNETYGFDLDVANESPGTNPWSEVTPPSQYEGRHDGGTSTSLLSDSTASWAEGDLVGALVFNRGNAGTATTAPYCTITANTATTATCTLGTPAGSWVAGNYYMIKKRPLPTTSDYYWPDNQPGSTHTYTSLQWIPALDAFCRTGNSIIAPEGSGPGNHLDCFDLNTRMWSGPAGYPLLPAGGHSRSAVHPFTSRLFYSNPDISPWGLYSWRPGDAVWSSSLASLSALASNHYVVMAIDTKRNHLVMNPFAGCRVYDLNTAPATLLNSSCSGGEGFTSPYPATGLVYDSKQDRIVAWAGGSAVGIMDPATYEWTNVSPGGAVPPSGWPYGPYSRFRYSQKYNVFVGVSLATQRVYVLRLSASPLIQDWATRSTAAGVVQAEGFEYTSKAQMMTNSGTPDLHDVSTDPYGTMALETSSCASGNGCLKIPVYKHYGANPGALVKPLKPDGSGFGSGDTFWVQYRVKYDPNMLGMTLIGANKNVTGGGWKTSVMYNHWAGSYSTVEFTINNGYYWNYIQGYGNQGYLGWSWSDAVNVYKQQGDYMGECLYANDTANGSNGRCFSFNRPNQWITLMYKLVLGTGNDPADEDPPWVWDSEFELWGALDGDRHWTKIFDRTIASGHPYIIWEGANPAYRPFDTIYFSPYTTGRLAADCDDLGETANPGVNCNSFTEPAVVWYDDLIVSTQEIALPATTGYTPPIPPPDEIAPTTSGWSPVKSATGVLKGARTISEHVTDDLSGVTGIIVHVAGGEGLTCGSGITCTGTANDTTVTYTHSTDWTYGQTVTVVVNASDVQGNAMAQESWSFTVESEPVTSTEPDNLRIVPGGTTTIGTDGTQTIGIVE